MNREGIRKIAVAFVFLLLTICVLAKISRAAEPGKEDQVKVEIVPVDIDFTSIIDFNGIFQSLLDAGLGFFVQYWWIVGGLFIVGFIKAWLDGNMATKAAELRAYEEREAYVQNYVAKLEAWDEAKERYAAIKAEREKTLHEVEVKQMEIDAARDDYGDSIKHDDGKNIERHTVWPDPDKENLGPEISVQYVRKRPQEVSSRLVNGERSIGYDDDFDAVIFEGDEPRDQVMRLAPVDETPDEKSRNTWERERDASFDNIVNEISSEQEVIRSHQKKMLDAFGKRPPRQRRVVRMSYDDDCGY